MQPPRLMASAAAPRNATARPRKWPDIQKSGRMSCLRFIGPFFACQISARCLTQGAPEKQGGQMILTQWRARRASRRLIDQLHGKIVAAARRPALFSELGAPDSFDG